MTRVVPSSLGRKSTTPALWAPVVFFQATFWSGTWWMISASHSLTVPAMLTFQWRCFSEVCLTSSTPSMNLGNSSNWVHWL